MNSSLLNIQDVLSPTNNQRTETPEVHVDVNNNDSQQANSNEQPIVIGQGSIPHSDTSVSQDQQVNQENIGSEDGSRQHNVSIQCTGNLTCPCQSSITALRTELKGDITNLKNLVDDRFQTIIELLKNPPRNPHHQNDNK